MRRRGTCGSIVAVLVMLLAATAADARPRFAGAFDLSGEPKQIARGPDGNIWVTLSGSSQNNTLARVQPNGTVTEFAPAAVVNPIGITSGPDGNLWLTRNGGVIRVPPANPDNAQDFDVNKITQPQAIRPGPQGKLWTASGDQLVSFAPGNPAGFDATTINGMSARGIAASGGRLWIADFGGGRIVSTTPGGNPSFSDVGGGPQEVAAGPNGMVAYGNPGTNPQTVGRIGMPGGQAKTTRVPLSDPFGIAFAPDGNWWFAEFAKHALGLLSVGGKVEQFEGLPDNSGPRHLAVGPKGTVWVSLETANKVAKVTGVAPQTRITRRPDNRVKARRGKAKVKFRFRSSAPGSSFECALKGDGGEFRRCGSPKEYRLGPGRYTFLVRAKSMGVTDPSPATDRFKVVRG